MNLVRTAVSFSALAAGVATASALVAGNRYLDRWQTLTPEELAEGEFCQLRNGWRIHYLERGQGETVVLIHGFMDSLHTWRRTIEALSTRYRVIAVDMPGFGCSERVTARVYSLKRMSEVLDEFLTRQGVRQATIVGHSLGGALAAQFAYDYPDRVDKLVFESAAVYLPFITTRLALSWLPASVSRGVIGLAAFGHTAMQSALPGIYGPHPRKDKELLRRRVQATRVRGSAEAWMAMLESPRATDLPRVVPEIAKPSLILWGARDRVVPLAHGRRLRRELPRARLVILSGAGHLPHEEYPVQVNEWFFRFLNKDLESLTETQSRRVGT
jgi:pimeloyl-ACP methyl ester carboxylesterase